MTTPKAEKLYIEKSLLEAKEHCTNPWVFNYSHPIPGASGLNLHQIMMIIGGSLGIVNLIICTYLIYSHTTCWTRPKEQKQYVRIIFFIFFMTLITFFSLMFYNATDFLNPIGQYYEGFAIIALYLLFTELLVAREPRLQYCSFGDVRNTIAVIDPRWGPGGKSLTWFRRSWILVFQIAIVRVATLIASEVVSSKNCPLSKGRTLGPTVIMAIQSFSTGLAVTSIVVFERRMRKHLPADQKPGWKFITFKVTVIFQAIQEIVFPSLAEAEIFLPTYPYYISYNDFAHGLPDLIFIFELFVSAILFLWTYNAHLYREDRKNGMLVQHIAPVAFLSCFNPTDYVKGVLSMFGRARPVDAKGSPAMYSGLKTEDEEASR